MAERLSAVLVTGGSSGIGLAICKRFLAQGRDVINLSLEAAPIQDRRLHDCLVDLSDRQALDLLMAKISDQFSIDIFVHNAGALKEALLDSVRLEDFDTLVNLHLTSALQIAKCLVPEMKSQGHGRIVFISSKAAMGRPKRTSYSTTKAGMWGMAKTWALELASFGITVNVVAPGPVKTPQFRSVVSEEQDVKWAAAVPVGRLGEPEDIAHAVNFLVDRDSSFITGQVIFVCGGTSIGVAAD